MKAPCADCIFSTHSLNLGKKINISLKCSGMGYLYEKDKDYIFFHIRYATLNNVK